jgi:hypothetical protein
MMFHDVPMNQSVFTEDSRGLTSYILYVVVAALRGCPAHRTGAHTHSLTLG